MIFSFVGTFDDSLDDLKRGNGKTMSMVYFLGLAHDAGQRVITNFYTSFSEQMTVENMINYIFDNDVSNVTLGITEMSLYMNNLGNSASVINFIDMMVSQSRKRHTDIYYDCQRWGNIHRRLRLQTDRILMPKKFHYDNSECKIDDCAKEHKIAVYCRYPYVKKPLVVLFANQIGKLYNSDQMVKDIPNVKRIKAKMTGMQI